MSFIIFFIIILISLFSIRTIPSQSPGNPDMAPFMNELTTELYMTFNNETKDERPSSVQDIMNATRRQLFFNLNWVRHYGSRDDISKGCYYTSVTYKAAMWDLRRYFEIRSLYTDSMDYEIGYLSHEIVHRYQLVLELYQMVERRFVSHEYTNFASVSYMFYIYTNILEQSKVIIHLCNMLHEVEKKYKFVKKGVFNDYGGAQKRNELENRSSVDENRLSHERWLQKQRQEEKRKQKERKKYWKQVNRLGLTTSRKKGTTRKRSWPIQYGWSIENW